MLRHELCVREKCIIRPLQSRGGTLSVHAQDGVNPPDRVQCPGSGSAARDATAGKPLHAMMRWAIARSRCRLPTIATRLATQRRPFARGSCQCTSRASPPPRVCNWNVAELRRSQTRRLLRAPWSPRQAQAACGRRQTYTHTHTIYFIVFIERSRDLVVVNFVCTPQAVV